MQLWDRRGPSLLQTPFRRTVTFCDRGLRFFRFVVGNALSFALSYVIGLDLLSFYPIEWTWRCAEKQYEKNPLLSLLLSQL